MDVRDMSGEAHEWPTDSPQGRELLRLAILGEIEQRTELAELAGIFGEGVVDVRPGL